MMDEVGRSLVGDSDSADGLGGGSGVDVGLLGAVRLVVDRRVVPLGGPRSRQLLALLALHANEMVGFDGVVEVLWGGAPPNSVRQQVYNVVAMLRPCLGEAARVERSGSGYRLVVEEERIDVVRFRRGVAGAERAVAGGEWAGAVGLFGSALGQWRGPALADLEGGVFRGAAGLLQEERLAAVESLSGALLRVGDAAGAVGWLRPLVGEHPFRESLRALLMRGLYRAGRQAEALTVFEEGRRVLAEELGVDPGAGLREAHREVLRGEEALRGGGLSRGEDGSAPVRGAGGGVGGGAGGDGTGAGAGGVFVCGAAAGGTAGRVGRGPCQLPADVRVLVGREGELAGLVELARGVGDGGAVTVSVIDGMGGVGKSALAVRAAHVLRGRFPDGQLYIDLHGHTPGMVPVAPGEALGSFLQALGVAPQQVPEGVGMRAALFRDRLADTRTLVVLDDAASTAQVEALLPGTGGCMVLVTSRRRLAGLGDAHQVSLGSLPEGVAVDLLRRAAEPAWVGDGYGVVAELAGLCGCLPLAVRIVAARLKYNRALTAGSLVAELREEESRLGRLSDGERELAGVFDSSVRVLPEQGRRLYRLLGLVPGPDFDGYNAAHLLGTDLHAAERLLQLLFDHNLLLQSAGGRYRFHDLLHAHARGLAATDAEGPEALDRLLEYYLHATQAANRYLLAQYRQQDLGDAPTGGPAPELLNQDQAVVWLRAEQSGLLAALSLPELGPAREISLIPTLSSHLMYEGMWSLAIGLHRRAAGIARERGDRLAEANALLGSTTVLERQGQHDEAVQDASRALAVYRDLGDRLGEAHALSALGQVMYVRSRHADAYALYEQVLEACEEVGDQRGTARAAWRLGVILSFEGVNVSAARQIRRAIGIYRDLGDCREEANCLLSYSRILYSLGYFVAVRPTLDRALALGRRYHFRICVASVLQETATYQVRAGEFAEATEALEEALRINRGLGFMLGEGYDYLQLGRMSLVTGDLDEALRSETRALGLFQRVEAVYEAAALESLARIHHARGDLDEAAALIQKAFSLFESDRRPSIEVQAEVRNAAAALKFDMEGPESALAEYESVMELTITAGVPYEYARALEGAARCELRLGHPEPGLAYLREAVDVYGRIGAMEYGPAAARLAGVMQAT